MKRKANISIELEIYDQARKIMGLRKFSELSSFIETLIREEWERRHGAVTFESASEPELRVAEPPIQYRIKKKKNA